MPGPAEFHHNEAARLADIAESSIALAIEGGATTERMEAVGRIANAAATLALAHRTAEQTVVLADLLGDDSHLDGLKVTLRDLGEGTERGAL